MSVSSIGSHGQHPRYEPPAQPPPKPEQKPHVEEYWKAKHNSAPKKNTEHKVDIKA